MNKLAPRCAKCGKSIASNTRGSLTAWLFSQSACNCEWRPAAGNKTDAPTPRRSERFGEETVQHPLRNEQLSRSQGQIINDRYKILSLIGTGGMGSVYRVLDQESQSICALKLINKDTLGQDNLERRLEHEARTIASLNHPNIVAIHDSGKTEDGSAFLTMDYIDGHSLEDLLTVEGALQQDRALGIFIQIAQSLVHAHSNAVVHRDLKPSNVLLVNGDDGAEVVKIVDFGIAKNTDGAQTDKTKLTQTGELIGSPLYMSPEQCQGSNLSARSDIYSFGCIMYETLSGQPPFEAENPVRVLLKHISEPAPSLPKKLQTHPGMNYLILRCLAKDPLDRYATSEALLQDLERLRDGKPIGTSLQSIIPRLMDKDPKYGYRNSAEFINDLKTSLFRKRGESNNFIRGVAQCTILVCVASAWLLCDAPGTSYAMQAATNGDTQRQANWHAGLARVEKPFALALSTKHAEAGVQLLQSYAATTDDLTQAESALNQAVSLEDEFSLSHKADAAQYLDLGNRLVKAGNYTSATKLYTKGWTLESSTPDSGIEHEQMVKDLNDKAKQLRGDRTLHQKENLIAAEIDQLRALTLCKVMAGDTDKEGPYQDLLSNCYNIMGWLYFDQRRFDEEISMFQAALNLHAIKTDPAKLAFRTYNLALGYTHAERLEEAETWFRRAQTEAKKAPDTWVEAASCAWLAWIRAEKKDYAQANTYAAKAFSLLKSESLHPAHDSFLPVQVFVQNARAFNLEHDTKAEEKAFKDGFNFLSSNGQKNSSPWIFLLDAYGRFLKTLPDRALEAEQVEQQLRTLRHEPKG